MKSLKQKTIEVTLHWQESSRGQVIDKSFKTDKKTAESHMQLMKNNPYVKNPRISKLVQA